jgi:hypothetical protein
LRAAATAADHRQRHEPVYPQHLSKLIRHQPATAFIDRYGLTRIGYILQTKPYTIKVDFYIHKRS